MGSVAGTGLLSAGLAAEVESRGTHANGKAYNNKYHFLITIADGQFVHVKEYMDTLHLAQLLQS